MHKLKNCPFCGGEASLSEGRIRNPDGTILSFPYVECLDCAANSDMKCTKDEVVENWNKRVSPFTDAEMQIRTVADIRKLIEEKYRDEQE